MTTNISELRQKEVINLYNGNRLGFVQDIDFDIETGAVKSVIIPGPLKFFGLFGRHSDMSIPWDKITKIGDDIILINYEIETGYEYNIKPSFFK